MNDYQNEWLVYKKLRTRFFFMWLAYVPVCITALIISVLIFGKGSVVGIWTTVIVAFVWVFLFIRLAKRLGKWKCPRCRERFHSWWKGTFTARCANCGLPRG
jgi:predicted transporter